MTRHVLSIDLGTSALKVALVSMAGEVVAAEQETCTVTLLPGGGAEQDPRRWWEQVTRASSRLMARAAVPAQSVAAVACTAQWSGTVPVDEHLQPVRPALIWMDSRGAPYVRRITSGAVRVQGYGVVKLARWLRTTAGIPAQSGKDPIAHILWLKHEEPETYRRAFLFLEPKDWLNACLTGRAAASFDSIALHWVTDNRHPDRIRYDPALLRLAGIEQSRLPELLAATDILGPLLTRAGRRARRPGRHPGRGRHARRPLGGDRGRGHPGLPGAPVRRHVILADLSRAVQEDRPAAQHGLAALAGTAPVLRRRRAGDRRRRPGLPARPGDVQRRPAPRVPRTRRDGGAGAARKRRGALHPVAVRRTDPRGRPVRARRIPQPVAVVHPRRPGTGGLRRSGAQYPLAARRRRALHPAPA